MDALSTLLTEKFLQRKLIDPEKSEIYRVGIKLILADLINFSLILLIGILTRSLIYSVLYIITIWTVRRFSGGFHAKTYLLCRILTVGIYVLVFLTSKLICNYQMTFTAAFDIIAIITMIAFAPIRHPNKELTNKEIKVNKLFSVITTLFFAVASIVLTSCNRKAGLVISLILFAITILIYVGMLTNGKEGKENVKAYR